MDVEATSYRVETLIINDDPATQQSDMESVTKLLQQMTPEEITEVTSRTLQGLSADDKNSLFVSFATQMDEKQLLAVAEGLRRKPSNQPGLIELNHNRLLADVGDLNNAINTFSDPDKRLRYSSAQQRGVMDSVVPRPAPTSGDAAVDARQAFMSSKLTSEKMDNPKWHYRLFMENPKVMAQPIINSHYRTFGTDAIPLESRMHVANVVSLAKRDALAAKIDNDPTRAQTQMRTENLFGGKLTRDENTARDMVVDKILHLGGDRPKVTPIPYVYALKDTGVHTSALFEVQSRTPGGYPVYVDDRGRDYKSIAKFLDYNKLPAQGVKIVLPGEMQQVFQEDGKVARAPVPTARPQLDEVTGNVVAYAGDARQEGEIEKARHYGDPIALGVGLGAGLVATGGQLGWLAPASPSLLAADGLLAVTGAYATAAPAYSLGQRVKFGDTLNPVKDTGVIRETAALLLGTTGLLQTATLGLGNNLATLARKEGQAAITAYAQGSNAAGRHVVAANSYGETSNKLLHYGEKLFPLKANTALIGGGAAMTADGTYDLATNWDEYQKAGQTTTQMLSLGLGAFGLGMASRSLLQQQTPQRFTPLSMERLQTGGALTGTAPLSLARGTLGGSLVSAESALQQGQSIRTFIDTPSDTSGTAGGARDSSPSIPVAVPREARWFKGSELPGDVAEAYVALLREANPAAPRDQLLTEIRARNVVIVTEARGEGQVEVVGGATIEPKWRGTRTLELGGVDTGITVPRDNGDNRVQSGDAYMGHVAGVHGGEQQAATAALDGAKQFTQAKRVVWATTNVSDQANYDRMTKDKEFSGLRRTFSTLQRDAVEQVNATPADQRTPGQTAALAQPNRREQQIALNDLTTLPSGAREIGYEFPIARELTVGQKLWPMHPDSYVGQFNANWGLMKLATKASDFFASPKVLEVIPATARGPERVITMYPPGTMSETQRNDHAQRIINANVGLPGNAYPQTALASTADDLNKYYVVQVTEVSKDPDGRPIKQLLGGASVIPRWAGSAGDGTWLGAELPTKASYLTGVFGEKGGGGQATVGAQRTAQLLKSPELDFYTRWEGAKKLYANLDVPVVGAHFTNEAPKLLLGKDTVVENLPNQVRTAVEHAKTLPRAEQEAFLSNELRTIESLDYYTTWAAARDLYGSVVQPGEKGSLSLAPTAASTLLGADPMIVDRLPPAMRDAVAASMKLPTNERAGALQSRLASIDLKATPMLTVPDGVQRLSYRQPVPLDPSWANRWASEGWRWTRESSAFTHTVGAVGSLRGRPYNPVEIKTFSAQGAAGGVERRATLYPPGTLSRDQLREQAELTLKANESRPNSPYGRLTTAQLVEQLNSRYVVQVRDEATGTLIGGAAIDRNWQGPQGDGRWLDNSVPKNTSHLTHVFGSQGSGEQATEAAGLAAQKHLLSDQLAFHTRWQDGQDLFSRMGMPVMEARFTDLAPDILLAAGPVAMERLPQAAQEAVSTARSLPQHEQRPYMREWLSKQNATDLAARLPNGAIDISYMAPIVADRSVGQAWMDKSRDVIANKIKPAANQALRVVARGTEAVYPYAGPAGIQPSPARQTVRDVGYVLKETPNAYYKYIGVPVLAASAGQFLTGDGAWHVNDDRATAPFNALPGSWSISLHAPWTQVTLSAWASPPAMRGMYGVGETPSLPMGRIGAPPGNPAGAISATGVVPARANGGEAGLGLQFGNNDLAWRGTFALRAANLSFNARGDIPLPPGRGANWGPSLLHSLTNVQPSMTSGLYVNRGAVVGRDMQLVLGSGLQLFSMGRDAAQKMSMVTSGRRAFLNDSVSASSGTFFTVNPVYGKPEPEWHNPDWRKSETNMSLKER
jgi:hypothetical protein